MSRTGDPARGWAQPLRAGVAAARRRRAGGTHPRPGAADRLPVLPWQRRLSFQPCPGPWRVAARASWPRSRATSHSTCCVMTRAPAARSGFRAGARAAPPRDGDALLATSREDDSVHAYHRATNADYRDSGFDRGHLAASAPTHRWSQKAMSDTFCLSNVALQCPSQPRMPEQPEKYKPQPDPHLPKCLCTGPFFLPRTEADGKSYVKDQVIGKNHVCGAHPLLQVLILERRGGQIELRSYVMPNAPVDEAILLERFLVPIESIEWASGLLFVPNILARPAPLRPSLRAQVRGSPSQTVGCRG
ncbi:Endonuclease G; mitochondrial [Camelus dromedarius]|uniref:Endonuclease n=1 Tax=Camelus dromedarius TaxID=9838 RepID=A0A5N4CCS2_CAMDR|nr:Endonuclease G; mitochondrial [Camelus dromedarius]